VRSGGSAQLARRLATAGAGAALLVSTAAPAGAASIATPYQFTIRAAAVEHYFHFFREVDSDAGYSRVQLSHDEGAESGSAQALGAAYWLFTDDAPCLLGCQPPCPDSPVINPTVAQTANPRSCNDRVPGLGAFGLATGPAKELDSGATSRVSARTPTQWSATGSSRVVDAGGTDGVDTGGVGSVSTASVDRVTGHYTGSADGFVTDLKLAGDRFATVTSMLRVTADPGTMPKVDYLLSLVATGGSGWSSGVDQTSVTLAGSRIPLVDLVSQVNTQLKSLGAGLASLADLGVRVLAPVTDYAPGTDRFRVSAPVLLIACAPAAGGPTPTHDTGVRVGTAVFEGSYDEPDPPLR
jgi:hypothetical protein